jgi:acetyltransferase-like isoleucine patch superfamily enzyme
MRAERFFFTFSQHINIVRGKFYSLFFKSVGKNFKIERNVLIGGMRNIEVGDNFFIGFGCVLNGGGGIKIGNNVLIAQGVKIYSDQHRYNKKEVDIIFQGSDSRPVYIDNNVWLCANCVILPGVHIGTGSVVGAGAVVTKDVGPYSVVGGVPAKIIKVIN